MTHLVEDGYRDCLAWLKALLTSDIEGVRAVTRNSDPARLVESISLLALALAIDPKDALAWVDRTFDQIGDILLISEARRQREEQRDNEVPP